MFIIGNKTERVNSSANKAENSGMPTQDILHSITRRLKALRAKHGMTQEEVARKAKCSLHYVQILESKEPSNVSVVTLEKIAKAFDMELWQFLRFEN